MKKNIYILFIFTILLGLKIDAQKLSSSPFSRFGVGELYFQGNGRQIAMGNTGIADFSPFHISKINPASISSLKPNSVIFEIGMFEKISVYNNEISTQTNNVANFRHFYGGFRIHRWWHYSFGINPYSGVGYKIRKEDSVYVNDYTTKITHNYEGKGGISQLFWTNSFTFFRHLMIGATVNYNFGSLEQITNSVINETDYISLTNIQTKNIIKKFDYKVGFIFADTIKKDQYTNKLFFSIGGFYTPNLNIGSYQTKYVSSEISMYGRTFSDSVFFDTLKTSQIIIPQSIGGGISLTFFDKFTFMTDYIYQDWSKSSNFGNTNYAKSTFIGLGAEFVASPISTRYYKTIRYRIGAYNYNSYIILNDQQVNTQAITFGLGFPVKTIQLNLGFVYGQTGNFDVGLKENFYEFNLNVSLYDLWFIKRKFM